MACPSPARARPARPRTRSPRPCCKSTSGTSTVSASSRSDQLGARALPKEMKMKKSALFLSVFVISALASTYASAADRKVVARTILKDEACVLIDADSLYPNPEIDFFRQECPGLAGYQVIFSGGDIRSYVGL